MKKFKIKEDSQGYAICYRRYGIILWIKLTTIQFYSITDALNYIEDYAKVRGFKPIYVKIVVGGSKLNDPCHWYR
jgi:hypothetical protein